MRLINSLDLVMWGKNSSRTLPKVLERIQQVIPGKFVQNRIFVDDNSVDNTKKIAQSCGWKVYDNQGSGIGKAANTALMHVESPYFASFEHDLLLAPNWWRSIPTHLAKSNVAVAQGLRVSDDLTLRSMEEFTIDLYRRLGERIYLKSIDNTIFKTEVLHAMGGFPTMKGGGIDIELARRISRAKYKWIIDQRVISIHLRGNVRNQLKHYYWYGKTNEDFTLLDTTTRFLMSPLISMVIALVKSCPNMLYVYPLMRFMLLKGYLDRAGLHKSLALPSSHSLKE